MSAHAKHLTERYVSQYLALAMARKIASQTVSKDAFALVNLLTAQWDLTGRELGAYSRAGFNEGLARVKAIKVGAK